MFFKNLGILVLWTKIALTFERVNLLYDLVFFRLAMEPGTGMIDDLASLSVLDEKTLLEELRIRYSRDIIYVSTVITLFFEEAWNTIQQGYHLCK